MASHNNLAPIVLFVYNRPKHTFKTLESLQQNQLADRTELFIFSDGPKGEEDYESVLKVRSHLKDISGFKNITLIRRDDNLGLAKNIINGVSTIIDKFGKVIVLEDDLITSPQFLNFMNSALNYYEEESSVWHISGWNYPINQQGLGDAFLWRTMNCWGWGTWKSRWSYFEKNTNKILNEFNNSDRRKFNLDGSHDFWKQVVQNKKGQINTWAIYWYATIFKHNGLCLNPSRSYIKNIGRDGSGTHIGRNLVQNNELNKQTSITFPDKSRENKIAVNRIKKYYKQNRPPIFIRYFHKMKRIIKEQTFLSRI